MKAFYQISSDLSEREELENSGSPVPPVRRHRKNSNKLETMKKSAKAVGNAEDVRVNSNLFSTIALKLKITICRNYEIAFWRQKFSLIFKKTRMEVWKWRS